MKKIFKNKRISNIIFGILGLIIGGTIGITATTYVLQANEIEYKNNKSVQEAIEELYTMAQNGGGSTETLPIGSSTAEGYKIIVPYTGSYSTISCMYGTTESYGNAGTIDGNTCTFTGTSSNQTLYYKIVASNNDGKIYENSGSATTGASGVTVVKTGLPTGVKAIIYLDPTNLGTRCTASNSTVGGTAKDGCMKWYAFKEDSTSYTMILDHNTTAKVAWNSSNSNSEMKEVQTELNNLKWTVIPRLITGQEVADITENKSWTAGGSNFYLDSNNQTQTATSAGASKYYWLYDYTSNCTSYGCKVADNSTYGYWTDTAYAGNSIDVWRVHCHGHFASPSAEITMFGVRPVITVSKSSL